MDCGHNSIRRARRAHRRRIRTDTHYQGAMVCDRGRWHAPASWAYDLQRCDEYSERSRIRPTESGTGKVATPRTLALVVAVGVCISNERTHDNQQRNKTEGHRSIRRRPYALTKCHLLELYHTPAAPVCGLAAVPIPKTICTHCKKYCQREIHRTHSLQTEACARVYKFCRCLISFYHRKLIILVTSFKSIA